MDSTLDSTLVSQPVQVKNRKKLGGNDDDQGLNKAKKLYILVSYKELPEYMKDNEFILNYYRANWSLKEALFSIFRWQNETLNVWTHFLGFVLFFGLTMANLMEVPQVAGLTTFFTRQEGELAKVGKLRGSVQTRVRIYQSQHIKALSVALAFILRSLPINGNTNVSNDSKDLFLGTTNPIDLNQITTSKLDITLPMTPVTRWPFYVFLGGSMFCLLCSSVCHLFSCHSHHLNIALLRIDYTGITTMIITSFFPPVYYIFQCDPHWHFVYLGGITTLGLFTIVTLLSPTLSTSKFRAFRALLFSSLALFGIVPGIHASVVNWSDPRRNVTLAYEFAMAIFYLTGTTFYVSRIPERFKPGWFDLAGHSHQMFHILVVMGALAHYGASLVLLEWRDHCSC